MSTSKRANHLLDEPSPYLQQHAYNPVAWYPWNEESLAKARSENKPILLSIGYAACHWCHVMAHESFEDEETADLMNQLFINIKVDKEERPDLDKIYQTAHYLLNQRGGGWPLTVFLTPDLTPFFSGTYFPREDLEQMPSFKRVLRTMAAVYQQQLPEIEKQNQQLRHILQQQTHTASSAILTAEPLRFAIAALEQAYDPAYGGFGGAPKFPQAPKLNFLLMIKSPLALATIKNLARGGIYDQLGGGFFRYAVDEQWQIPHFEKMLYDNGQLLSLYARASQVYNETSFKGIISETANWLREQMQAPDGGYYSSLDADSEGEEGKYYRWNRDEVQAVLTPEEYRVLAPYYGLEQAPNFEDHWHFYVSQSLNTLSQRLNLSLSEANKRLASAREKLLKARQQRLAPFRDEKVLTAWNGLMIKGMLLAGSCLEDEHLLASAQQALHFIQHRHWQDGLLFASSKDGKPYLSAYLDDYVFLLDALLCALQISWQSEHLAFAIELVEIILKRFSDEAGGFFFTVVGQQEKLLYRPKTMMDEAIPAANGILVPALLTLGYLLGEPRYLKAAEKTLQAAWPILNQYPAEHCSLLVGLENYLRPRPIIILRGEAKTIKAWQAELQAIDNYILAIPTEAKNLPPTLALKKAQGNVTAYLCRGMHCEAVIEDKARLKRLLED